ncbi:hypothetical protein BKA80DRAFT_261801 [Phyllosticta citrichinensis]
MPPSACPETPLPPPSKLHTASSPSRAIPTSFPMPKRPKRPTNSTASSRPTRSSPTKTDANATMPKSAWPSCEERPSNAACALPSQQRTRRAPPHTT